MEQEVKRPVGRPPAAQTTPKPAATSNATAPVLRYKGQETFRHDLFKLKPTNLKRNLSYRAGQVQIEEISHSHFFHTVDSSGREQIHSTPTAGHFHDVKWEVDAATGDLKAKCGPPMRYVYVKRGRSQKKEMQRVSWHDAEKNDMVVDNHTHVCDYLWSEELSGETIRQRRSAAENRAQVDMERAKQAREIGAESGFD